MTRPRFLVIGFAGALANLAYAVYRLPAWEDCFRLSRTPLDHSAVHDSAPDYALLRDAASAIPTGTSVVVRTVRGDAGRDAILFRFAIALLPGRKIVPAPPGSPVDMAPGNVEYVVLRGSNGRVAEADVLRADDEGSIWKVRPR